MKRHIFDSYDFNGDQPLGYWNSETGYVGPDFRKGDYVNNESFRKYRSESGYGSDYIVYSDIIPLTLIDPVVLEISR